MGKRAHWDYDSDELREKARRIYQEQPGLTYDAIAKRLGISVSSVQRYLAFQSTTYPVLTYSVTTEPIHLSLGGKKQ